MPCVTTLVMNAVIYFCLLSCFKTRVIGSGKVAHERVLSQPSSPKYLEPPGKVCESFSTLDNQKAQYVFLDLITSKNTQEAT